MKKIVLLMLVVFLTSCATINVSEKSAFQESKYKFDEYSNYINKLDKTPEEKKALLN